MRTGSNGAVGLLIEVFRCGKFYFPQTYLADNFVSDTEYVLCNLHLVFLALRDVLWYII